MAFGRTENGLVQAVVRPGSGPGLLVAAGGGVATAEDAEFSVGLGGDGTAAVEAREGQVTLINYGGDHELGGGTAGAGVAESGAGTVQHSSESAVGGGLAHGLDPQRSASLRGEPSLGLLFGRSCAENACVPLRTPTGILSSTGCRCRKAKTRSRSVLVVFLGAGGARKAGSTEIRKRLSGRSG